MGGGRGKLIGDIVYRRGSLTAYFPVLSMTLKTRDRVVQTHSRPENKIPGFLARLS